MGCPAESGLSRSSDSPFPCGASRARGSGRGGCRTPDRLPAAGREFGIRPGGYRVLDSLRMEKGYRYYGTDLTQLDNPFEAGLGFCVQMDKGEFNGREALLAARESGIKRRLRTLAIGGDEYLTIYGGEAVH